MFENIIGHKKEKELLINFLEKDNISHAYLFSGKKGIGKSKIAKEFAKEILKTQSLESCPDFKYITKKEVCAPVGTANLSAQLQDFLCQLHPNSRSFAQSSSA